MQLKLIFAFLLAVCFFSSCRRNDCREASGERWSFERKVGTFSSIQLNTAARLDILQDTSIDQPLVKVYVQGNIEDLISTKVLNDILVLDLHDCIDENAGIKFEITVPELRYLISNSSGDIYSKTGFVQDSISLWLQDNGDLNLTLNTSYLYTKSAGTGTINLSGYAMHHEAYIEQSGDLEALNLGTRTTEIQSNGSGISRIWVTDLLDASVTSRGSIYYIGNPSVTTTISGSGSVEALP